MGGFEVERMLEKKILAKDTEVWKRLVAASLRKYCEVVREEGRFKMDMNLLYAVYCLCMIHHKLEDLSFETVFNLLKNKSIKEISGPDP